eukprot:TRINITY_DN138137_c0_g1_i1.p2 TRINITY_DN138137_c0_g1~~TRINITY_DN138137_c0_g1_i1.p2  ORF type:complete len:199 (-),score=5.10 TRINITY_DN138137_c0_g1_i1:486-1082(-)
MKPEAEVEPGHLENLTPEQEQTLATFKAEVAKKNAEEWEYDLTKFDNYDYLRFLRARKFSLKNTLAMFSAFVKWRKDYEVDKIFVRAFVQNKLQTYKFPELPLVKKEYLHGYHKVDKLVFVHCGQLWNRDDLSILRELDYQIWTSCLSTRRKRGLQGIMQERMRKFKTIFCRHVRWPQDEEQKHSQVLWILQEGPVHY